ncbi:MAG: hypothetical protein AVDCRST_MAG78-2064, partial [uncultured Rubrobacteraceae bacterium]
EDRTPTLRGLPGLYGDPGHPRKGRCPRRACGRDLGGARARRLV